MYSIDCLAAESYSEILSKVKLLTLEAHYNTWAGQSTNLLGSWTAKRTLWPPCRSRDSFLLPALASWQNSQQCGASTLYLSKVKILRVRGGGVTPLSQRESAVCVCAFTA